MPDTMVKDDATRSSEREKWKQRSQTPPQLGRGGHLFQSSLGFLDDCSFSVRFGRYFLQIRP